MKTPLDRSLFDLGAGLVWAMHCAEGPVPRPAIEAVRAFCEKELRPWELGVDEWLGLAGAVKREAGQLFGADEKDFTITHSTSHALTCLAQSHPWREGDEVLAPLGEFPANAWPWKALARRGVGFCEVPLWDGHLAGRRALESTPPPPGLEPEARLLAAIGPKTRLMTVSWVRFQDGIRLDVSRLAKGCADRGVSLVVDAIQGAGVLPMPLEGLAAVATGAHKGLLSPQGAGLLWTSPPFRASLSPLGSWLSVEGGSDFARPSTDLERDWLPDGRKFEQGGGGGLLLVPFAQSLRILREAGLPAIARHVDALQASLLAKIKGPFEADAARLERLRREGRLGPILGFHHGGRADALAAKLREGFKKKIFSSVREGYLRVALHGWHDEADVERIAAWLS